MSVKDLIALQNDSLNGPQKSLMNERTIGKMVIDFEYMIAKLWLLREKELGWIDYSLDFIV